MTELLKAVVVAVAISAVTICVYADDDNKPAADVELQKPAPLKLKTTLELETTSIKGLQGLPKVLVIVPWKSASVIEKEDRPLAILVEEVLTPLDPQVLRRQNNYYNSLQKNAKERLDENE